MTELEVKEAVINNNLDKKKGYIDFFAFFMAPLFVLVMIEIMHLWHVEAYPQIFGNPFFLVKWLISYVFLLGMQSALLVVTHNLAVAHTIQMVAMWFMGMVTEVLLTLTGDPLLPSDLLLVDNIEEIASFVEIPLLAQYVVSALFGIFSIIFFFKRRKVKKAKLSVKSKIAFSLAAVIFFGGSVYAMCFNRIIKYRAFEKMDIQIAAFNPQSDYYANGLILTFFPRIGELRFQKPEGYSAEKIAEIKSKDDGNVVEGNVRPNIIAIQNEALWDVTLLQGTEFSRDPLENIRRIGSEQNGKMGTLISPVFAGGTCMPEFEFLTGLSINFLPPSVSPYIQTVNRPTLSLVKTYKENGYETYALHPYKKNFYGRNKAYPLLGFDTFVGDEDMETPEVKGRFISDMEVTRQLINAFENKKKDRFFGFSVTIQNHGGYTVPRYESYDIEVNNPSLDEDMMVVLREYTQGIYDSDVAFDALVEYFRNVSEPTIIVMYGDHLPLLGEDGRPYTDTGFIEAEEKFTQSNHPQLYKTPYIVWANYDVDFSGFADPISPANLGLSVYKLSGVESSPWYYSFIDNFYTEYPVYSPYTIEDKYHVTISQTEDKHHEMAVEYKLVQYDILRGNKKKNEQKGTD